MAIFLGPLLILHVLCLILENYFLLLQSSTVNFLCQSRKGETRGVHIRRKSSVRKREGLPGRRMVSGKKENHWTAEKVKGEVANMQLLALQGTSISFADLELCRALCQTNWDSLRVSSNFHPS